MVPVVPSLSTEHSKATILALSQEFRYENNVIGKIWYRNPSKSEVIGRCGGDEKRPPRTDKSRTLNKNNMIHHYIGVYDSSLYCCL